MNKPSDIIANLVDFKGLQLRLASSEEILSWSHGEITKPETINYRTLKPEKDGLFSESIFGPTKDWECYCGKYKRIRYRGIVCDKCGVEVTLSKVRRERMGHITLACPVAHVWYFKGTPSVLSLLLDISPRALENIIYFAAYLVTNVDESKRDSVIKSLTKTMEERKGVMEKDYESKIKEVEKLGLEKIKELKEDIGRQEERDLAASEAEVSYRQKMAKLTEELSTEKQRLDEIYKMLTDLVKSVKPMTQLSEDEYLKLYEYDAGNFLEVGMGAEAIVEMCKKIDLNKLTAQLRQEALETTGPRHVKATKRLKVVDGLRRSKQRPEWMVLTALPVIPPDLRPMVQLSGGRFATSDLNDLYRRVINRNNRLKHLIDLGAPSIILRNEKRMLQEAVDSLIDASQRQSTRADAAELKSLSDMLRGKQGRFRQNLLGKRVDYSGRSVIVVGPHLKLSECGLPKEMALEMFKPFVLRELIIRGIAPNVPSAKFILNKRVPEVYDILEEITKNHPVLLNRAPTLHKLSIQAFLPILIEGSAIQIHPLVCDPYNADFDGDQMAVHVPLSSAAKKEALELMTTENNLLKPSDGMSVVVPKKEMILGIYYFTSLDVHLATAPTIFSDFTEVVTVYQNGKISLRQKIKVRHNGKIIETSAGRVLFNEIWPEGEAFINEAVTISKLKNLFNKAMLTYPKDRIVKLLDDLKKIGFEGATDSGISVSVYDFVSASDKDDMIKDAEGEVSAIEQNYYAGLTTKEEMQRLSQDVWMKATEAITDSTWNAYTGENPVKMILESGAGKSSRDTVKQVSGMRGLMVDPTGKIVQMPTKSNFRQGLSVFEYVTGARGSRKGLADSALRTADAGYLTRRLVDVAHDMIIRISDCGTSVGLEISKKDKRTTAIGARIIGRVLAQDVLVDKKIVLSSGDLIDEKNLSILEEHKVESVVIRSPLTCKSKFGICQKCYGRDYSTRALVEIGTPVGIVAAQSIGEPGTQLTLRTKHTGGIVAADVTQGLPRVEELFEARVPKVAVPLSEIAGRVELAEVEGGTTVRVRSDSKPVEEKEYFVAATSQMIVSEGDIVGVGTQLANGLMDVKEVLAIRGLLDAQKYLISELQSVYEGNNIPIADKHFEVIVRRMSDKLIVEASGDTALLPGDILDRVKFEEENSKIIAEGGEPATAKVTVLGVSRAALCVDSWLSAASFEQTTQQLTYAAIEAKIDPLIGMKENVIIGRLIPTSEDRVKINANN